MKETYIFKALCDNCETYIPIKIPKGMLVETFFEKKKPSPICPHCGCKVIQ